MNRMGGGVNAGKKLHREISGIHTHTHQSRLENNHSAAFIRDLKHEALGHVVMATAWPTTTYTNYKYICVFLFVRKCVYAYNACTVYQINNSVGPRKWATTTHYTVRREGWSCGDDGRGASVIIYTKARATLDARPTTGERVKDLISNCGSGGALT